MPFFAFVHQHALNSDPSNLQPCPLEMRRHLFAGVSPLLCGPSGTFGEIGLSIGANSEVVERVIVEDKA